MFDLDYWGEIWQTLSQNKKRSLMTAFGVSWGIFMLIVMTGAGEFIKRKSMRNIDDMATNSCFFFTDQTSIPYKGFSSGRMWKFHLDDIDAIEKHVKGVKYVIASSWGGQSTCSHQDKVGLYAIQGEMPEQQLISPQAFLYGRYINELDMQQSRKVCVLGPQVYKELFAPEENPEGKQILVQNTYLTVIGVALPLVQGFGDAERAVIMPLAIFQQLYNKNNDVDMITVTGEEDIPIRTLEEEIFTLLADRHQISPDDAKAIQRINLGKEYTNAMGLFSGISILTWLVGGGTLLAGLIGISNIMLITVKDRTQEIGIRRALGAKPHVIIQQILGESFILTFLAGAVGLFAGVTLLSGVDALLAGNTDTYGLAFPSCQVPFGFSVIALFVLIFGGLLAGIIPATKALIVKPVDAIRDE